MRWQNKLFVVVLCLMAGVAQGTIFNDGLVHDIDYEITDWLEIKDSPTGKSTHVNLLAGAIIREQCSIWHTSELSMYDGTLESGVISYNSTKLEIYEGAIGTGGYYFGYGGIRAPFSILAGGRVRIYDGFIGADVVARTNCLIDIYGGTITGDIDVNTDGSVVLHGQNFLFNGNPIGYTTFGNGTIGHLTGELLNGDTVDCSLRIGEGSISLIPEPATLLLLGLGAVKPPIRVGGRR